MVFPTPEVPHALLTNGHSINGERRDGAYSFKVFQLRNPQLTNVIGELHYICNLRIIYIQLCFL